jgi:hypothetical protein
MRHARPFGMTGAALLALLAAPIPGVAQEQARLGGENARLQAGSPAMCAGMGDLIIPNTRITSAQMVPAGDGLPEYCDLFGVVSPAVGFELRLPAQWNQKLYFGGNGAFAGSIPDTQGLTSFGLSRGYATASTDTGHEADPFDASWALNNHPAEIEYGYRGVHVTAVVAKIIVAAYYGVEPQLSYFDGCSKGGQEGLREAEQYPGDFNGIADGAPALDFTGTLMAANWNMQALHATVDSSVIPVEKVPVIGSAVLANCDAVDGLIDGLIDDPRRCSFDPETLRCLGGDAPDCLTGRQVRALEEIYSGPTDSFGRRLFPGLPVGGETVEWDIWLISTPDAPSLAFALQDQFFRYLAFPVDDPNFDWATFDFDTDPQRLRFMAGTLNATNPDLSEFRKAGGKLLLYHGWSDPIIAATRTIDYYENVRRELGSKKTKEFARLFLAPGMSHCGGGSGPFAFDYFTALEGWVEQGIAPESMVAYHYDDYGNMDRSRPLCAYPQVARYQGRGSIDDAANFRCVSPQAE